MAYESQFTALAHPIRQQILLNLRGQSASVRELTDGLNASQPVVSQHLKVLREAGLVSATADGAKRLYQLEPEALENLRLFLEQHWSQMLSGLGDET